VFIDAMAGETSDDTDVVDRDFGMRILGLWSIFLRDCVVSICTLILRSASGVGLLLQVTA